MATLSRAPHRPLPSQARQRRHRPRNSPALSRRAPRPPRRHPPGGSRPLCVVDARREAGRTAVNKRPRLRPYNIAARDSPPPPYPLARKKDCATPRRRRQAFSSRVCTPRRWRHSWQRRKRNETRGAGSRRDGIARPGSAGHDFLPPLLLVVPLLVLLPDD